jgi:hypothetical protein
MFGFSEKSGSGEGCIWILCSKRGVCGSGTGSTFDNTVLIVAAQIKI